MELPQYLIFSIFVASALCCGHIVLSKFQKHLNNFEWFIFSLSIGMAVLSYATYALAVCNFLKFQYLIILLIFPLIFLGKITPRFKGVLLLLSERLNFHEKIILIFIYIHLFVYFLAAGALPIAYDVLSYHLALPKLYLKHQGIYFIPHISPSAHPALLQMLYTLVMSVSKPSAAHLVHWLCGILLLFFVFGMSSLIFNKSVGLMAMAILVSTILFKVLAVTGLIDLGFGLYALLSFYALLKYLRTDGIIWLVLCAIGCGLSISTKYLGAFWIIAIVPIIVCKKNNSSFNLKIRKSIKNLLIFFSIIFIVLLPWMLRIYCITGNPFWPYFSHYFGGEYIDNKQVAIIIKYGENIPEQKYLINIVKKAKGLFSTSAKSFFKPGFLVNCFFILTLTFMKRINYLSIYILYCVIGIYILMYLLFMPETIRYLIPIMPLMAIIIAYYLQILYSSNIWKKMVSFIIFCSLVLFTSPFADKQLWGKMGVSFGLISEKKYLQGLDIYRVSQWINQNLTEKDTLLLLNEERGFYLNVNYIWGTPISQKYISYENMEDTNDLLGRWREKGVTHVLVNGINLYWPIENKKCKDIVVTFLSSWEKVKKIDNYYIFYLEET